MKLNVKALALACGIVWGLSVFLLTYWYLIFGHPGLTLDKLRNIYFGYSVTWFGGIVGLIWGFIDGFIGGAFLAWLYNKFTKEQAPSSETE